MKLERFGVRLRHDRNAGFIVAGVQAGSSADSCGLQIGWKLLSIEDLQSRAFDLSVLNQSDCPEFPDQLRVTFQTQARQKIPMRLFAGKPAKVDKFIDEVRSWRAPSPTNIRSSPKLGISPLDSALQKVSLLANAYRRKGIFGAGEAMSSLIGYGYSFSHLESIPRGTAFAHIAVNRAFHGWAKILKRMEPLIRPEYDAEVYLYYLEMTKLSNSNRMHDFFYAWKHHHETRKKLIRYSMNNMRNFVLSVQKDALESWIEFKSTNPKPNSDLAQKNSTNTEDFIENPHADQPANNIQEPGLVVLGPLPEFLKNVWPDLDLDHYQSMKESVKRTGSVRKSVAKSAKRSQRKGSGEFEVNGRHRDDGGPESRSTHEVSQDPLTIREKTWIRLKNLTHRSELNGKEAFVVQMDDKTVVAQIHGKKFIFEHENSEPLHQDQARKVELRFVEKYLEQIQIRLKHLDMKGSNYCINCQAVLENFPRNQEHAIDVLAQHFWNVEAAVDDFVEGPNCSLAEKFRNCKHSLKVLQNWNEVVFLKRMFKSMRSSAELRYSSKLRSRLVKRWGETVKESKELMQITAYLWLSTNYILIKKVLMEWRLCKTCSDMISDDSSSDSDDLMTRVVSPKAVNAVSGVLSFAATAGRTLIGDETAMQLAQGIGGLLLGRDRVKDMFENGNHFNE
eukprot:746962-Hanusia_phi.AAC.6